MRRFEYRAPRFPADVSVRLTLDQFSMSGRCIQISSEGMRGRFEKPLEQRALGTLTIRYCDVCVDVPIQVAHCEPNYEGLKFLFSSAVQRNSVERLIGLITAPPNRRRLRLVK